MARLRTIKDAIAELTAADAGNALTENALRQMVIAGDVPCLRAGKKYLINLDALEQMLSAPAPAAAPAAGQIRRVLP